MSRIWLIAGAGLLGALLVAALVVALTQQEEPLPEGTPERTVQLFLVALQDEDFKLAHSLLSEEQRLECPLEEIAASAFGRSSDVEDSRVTLEKTTYLDGTALVIARVTRFRGSGPFGTSESAHEERYTLVKEDGEWRLSRHNWPYYGCDDRFPEPARPVRAAEPASTPAPAPRPTPSP
jgi:hypothetical protein